MNASKPITSPDASGSGDVTCTIPVSANSARAASRSPRPCAANHAFTVFSARGSNSGIGPRLGDRVGSRDMAPFQDIRAAVVGTGFIGVVHVEALRRLGVEVTGVVGSTPERAREKARTAVLPDPYESFETMLADERVDVVHVTSPNKLHHPQARAALAAGKHVVCEKPLAMNSRETAELLELAERSGLVHAVNFNIRFYSQVIEAYERVARGELGAVHQVTGSYLQDWLLLDTDWNWRLDPAEGGELRAVGDIGSHWIDLLQYVTGRRVESVVADLKTVIPVRQVPTGPVETFAGKGGADGERVAREISTEDIAGFMLRLEGGARAVGAVSQLSAG